MAKKEEKYTILDGDDWFEPPIDIDEYLNSIETEVEDPDWYVQYSEISRTILKKGIIDDNSVVCSPFSFYILMTILLNATDKKTKKEIKDAIFPKGSYVQYINNTIIGLQREYTRQMKGGRLVSSNALFVKKDEGLVVKESFIETLRKDFGGELFNENGDILTKVNDWVNKKTEGMIPTFLDKEPEKAVLMNALAFNVKWDTAYDPYAIEEGGFTTFDDEDEECTMLYSEEKIYVEDEHSYGFIKDYKGDRFAFIGLLPKKEGREAFEKTLENVDILSLFKNKIETDVDVSIPEFQVSTSIQLNDYCEALGIKTIFTDNADMSAMVEGYPLKVESILQKAYISVDRNGTKAAAITGAVVCAGCIPDLEKKSVDLDRPFIYAIINKHSGIPVFLGAVTSMSS